VRLQRSADGVLLDVEDDGPGISEDVMAHLFEPFFTTKASGKGTGLGLAISQRLVVTLGGRLSAGLRPGGGARFRVALPAP
jgi:C4-dicarboxylate-specific signal transduction histidine kinase